MGALGAVIVILLALLAAVGIWYCRNRRVLRGIAAMPKMGNTRGNGVPDFNAPRDSMEYGVVDNKTTRPEYWK